MSFRVDIHYKDLFDLFLQIIQADLLDEQLIESDSKASLVKDAYAKLKKYTETVTPAIYKNDFSDILFDLACSTFAASKATMKAINPVTEVYNLEPAILDNLLKSFGFNYLALPEPSKRYILSVLVHAYKKKGSIESIRIILESLIKNISIKELDVKVSDNDVTFVYEQELNSLFNTESNAEIGLSYDNVVDKHWIQDKNSIISSGIHRARSPFFIISKQVTPEHSAVATALLKNFAEADYDLYLNDYQAYIQRKHITIATFPEVYTYLEIWYIIQYIWTTVNNIETFPTNPTLGWRSTRSETIREDFAEQFNQRYTTQFYSAEYIRRHKIHSDYKNIAIGKVTSSYIYKYEQDRTNPIVTVLQNKIAVLFGRDSNNQPIKELTIIDCESGDVQTFVIDLWLEDSIVYSSYETITFYGGKDELGNPNTYIYTIDLDTMTINKSADPVSALLDQPNIKTIFNEVLDKIVIVEELDDNSINIYELNTIDSYPQLIVNIPNIQNTKLLTYNLTSITIVEAERNGNRVLVIFDPVSDNYTIYEPTNMTNLNNPFIIYPYNNLFILIQKDSSQNATAMYISIDSSNGITVTEHTDIEYLFDKTRPEYSFDEDSFSIMVTPNIACVYSTYPTTKVMYYTVTKQMTNFVYEELSKIKTNSNNAYSLKQDLLDKRQDLISYSTLPIFSNRIELRDFLYNLVPDTINFIDNATNKLDLFYLIITQLSIDLEVDMMISNLETSIEHIKTLVKMFKPIYTRMLPLTTTMLVQDPVGDWLVLEDSITNIISTKNFDYLPLKTYISMEPEISSTDNLNITDNPYPYVQTTVSAISTEYLDNNIQEWSSFLFGVTTLAVSYAYMDTHISEYSSFS